ncbi:uncharacterized protein LOC110105527 [Dendrobium catenatum]|uniref:uncharacterized protein LOC110105527 n=1 Tax=Dendrobium catenatum TaxID=906689 RepID=UPI0010A07688|nr:uncharacterized protein LOC110105527 [Dendrobium catenatum]
MGLGYTSSLRADGLFKEEMANKMKKLDSVPAINAGKGITTESSKLGICLNNSFAVLNEDSDADCLGKLEESVKLLDMGREVMNDDVVSYVKPCISGSARVRIAKGARKKEAALYLKEVVRDHDIFFIGLMETKMTNISRKDVDGLIGKDWDYFHFPAVGLSGGILVLWNMKIGNFVVKDTSSQMIVGDLSIPRLGIWRIATVYGSRCCKERESLWSLLGNCMVSSNPSIVGGDFNCVLSKEEKGGGKRFTWCNNKEGTSRIWERLDRCLLNSAALQLLPSTATRHLARVASDHSPIAFNVDDKVRVKSRIIRFEDTWRLYPAARSIVYHSWKKNDFGEEGMVLQMKINRTLKALFFWSKSKCKDLNELKEKLKMDILEFQHKEAMGGDWLAHDLILIRSKIHELNVTLKRLSTWWNQWDKARWLEEGDSNSKLFHNFATARRNGNKVNQIKDIHNVVQIEDEEIEKVFIQHFEAKWKVRDCQLTG